MDPKAKASERARKAWATRRLRMATGSAKSVKSAIPKNRETAAELLAIVDEILDRGFMSFGQANRLRVLRGKSEIQLKKRLGGA